MPFLFHFLHIYQKFYSGHSPLTEGEEGKSSFVEWIFLLFLGNGYPSPSSPLFLSSDWISFLCNIWPLKYIPLKNVLLFRSFLKFLINTPLSLLNVPFINWSSNLTASKIWSKHRSRSSMWTRQHIDLKALCSCCSPDSVY